MHQRDEILAGILAGGGSRRYGSDKCLASLNGKPLLNWAVSYGRRVSDSVYLLSKEREQYGESISFPGLPDDLPRLKDQYTVSTPISGILTIAPFVKKWLLLLACDIFLPDPAMLDLLVDQRREDKAVLFRVNGSLQPFLAIYPKSLLFHWEEAFRRADYRLRRVVERMPRIEIDEALLEKKGFTGTPLFNINTPRELKRVEQICGF